MGNLIFKNTEINNNFFKAQYKDVNSVFKKLSNNNILNGYNKGAFINYYELINDHNAVVFNHLNTGISVCLSLDLENSYSSETGKLYQVAFKNKTSKAVINLYDNSVLKGECTFEIRVDNTITPGSFLIEK
jgi:hypothetical protein